MRNRVKLQESELDKEVRKTVLEVARLLKDDKAKDIIVLDLRGLTSITDYFVICTVNSTTQTKSIVRDIEELLLRKKLKPINPVENYNSPWVLFDYNDFVLHIFLKEGRDFYQLERLWSDAEMIFSSEDEDNGEVKNGGEIL